MFYCFFTSTVLTKLLIYPVKFQPANFNPQTSKPRSACPTLYALFSVLFSFDKLTDPPKSCKTSGWNDWKKYKKTNILEFHAETFRWKWLFYKYLMDVLYEWICCWYSLLIYCVLTWSVTRRLLVEARSKLRGGIHLTSNSFKMKNSPFF